MLKRFAHVDMALYVFPILLWLIGCAVLWSLTYASPDRALSTLAIRQLVNGGVGIVAMLGMTIINYRALRPISWIIALACLLLLLAVEFFGATSLGATRWLNLGLVRIQPAEIAKIGLIVVLASTLADYVDNVGWKVFVRTGVITIPLVVLVLRQPDLGTASVLSTCAIGMLLVLRLKRRHVVTLSVLTVLIMIGSYLAYASIGPFKAILHDYQRDRISTFINPDADPLGKGYNVQQAIIAIGNGGLYGRGLGRDVGQLSQLQFLPKAHTDFIFAALSEALGFIGASLVLALFAGMIWRINTVAHHARDGFGMLIAFGYLTVIASSVVVNVGMNLGMLPVTGIPLPFVSAGGTTLIIHFIGIGLLQSIMSRRRVISFD